MLLIIKTIIVIIIVVVIIIITATLRFAAPCGLWGYEGRESPSAYVALDPGTLLPEDGSGSGFRVPNPKPKVRIYG